MAIILNTSHPLYANLKALICVDTDGSIVGAKGTQTLTPHANVTVNMTGTYGRSFRTLLDGSSNAQGVAMSPGVVTMGTTTNAGTVFVVVNAANSWANRGSVFNTAQTNGPMGPRVTTGDAVAINSNTAAASAAGSTDIVGTGAHSFAVGGDSNTHGFVWVDGVLEASPTVGVGNASNNASTYIGGNSAGGFGGLAADYVWIAVFDKLLSTAEVADLHASLGSNNTFGLVQAPVPVSSDLAPSYAVNAYVSADINASYAMSGMVSSDLGATFNVSDGTAVSSDLSATYGVYANITADLSAAYNVNVWVAKDLAASYGVASAGLFTSDVWINNTDMPWAPGTSVKWTWVSAGRVGSISGKTLNEGTAALNGASRLALSGLPTGPGFLLGAVLGVDAANDQPYYQGGVVA